MICPIKKYGNEYNEIPVKVSVNIRAIVTAGLAKDVEDVNQEKKPPFENSGHQSVCQWQGSGDG